MTLFLTFTVLGLVLGAVYAIAASGLVLTYNTSGIFNFAHGAQAMIGAFLYYQLQVVWGVPTLPGRADPAARRRPADGLPAAPVHHGRPARHRRGDQDRGHRRDPARLRVALPVGVGSAGGPDHEDVLRRRQLHHDRRGRDPLPRDHLPARRRGDRGRPAADVHSHPDRRADARHRGRSRPAAPQRPRPRADRGALLGTRLQPRGPGRHPDHPDRGRRAGGQRPHPARDRRLRRRALRPAAQHPAHVRRRVLPRPGQHLPGRLRPDRVDLDHQPARRAADDRAVHRPAPASPGPAPWCRGPHPGALRGATGPPSRGVGGGHGRRDRGVPPAGRRLERRHAGARHLLRDRRAVPDVAHRVRRRAQPGPDLLRRHRHDRGVPQRDPGSRPRRADEHPRSARRCARRCASPAPWSRCRHSGCAASTWRSPRSPSAASSRRWCCARPSRARGSATTSRSSRTGT